MLRLGVNIDNAAGSKTELSRKRTSDQVDAFYQMGIDFLAEPSDPFGNQDVINPKLEVGMFIADMELSKRVLRYARGPEDDLIE